MTRGRSLSPPAQARIRQVKRRARWDTEALADLDRSYMAVSERSTAPTGSYDLRQFTEKILSTDNYNDRELKDGPYQHELYADRLAWRGSYMYDDEHGPTTESEKLYQSSITTQSPWMIKLSHKIGHFQRSYETAYNKNEAWIMQHVSPYITPAATRLWITSALESTRILEDAYSETWSTSPPFCGPQPRPDHIVGYKPRAFTTAQVQKIDQIKQSIFVATPTVLFPFLTCEVKSAMNSLDVGDRQNCHSQTAISQGLVGLFRRVGRQKEIDRRITNFSITHNHRIVRIYGHYAVIEGLETKYYRHQINEYDFAVASGHAKWFAYSFVRTLYEIWMPSHRELLCSVLDSSLIGGEPAAPAVTG